MKDEDDKRTVHVVGIAAIPQRHILAFAIKVAEYEPPVGTVLISCTRLNRWQIVSYTFTSAEQWAQGIRVVIARSLDHGPEPVAGDGLGSVRQTLSDSVGAGTGVNYDPWGTPQGGATPPAFGFTGEWQDAGVGLVNLRARWYAPGQGRFTARDPFAGFDDRPYSLHPYQYAYADPVRYTDPSGQCIFGLDTIVCVAAGVAVVGDAAAGASFDYGVQVFQNHQQGLRGRAAFTTVNGRRLGVNAAAGAVSAGVGFVAGPVIAGWAGAGLKGSLLAGAGTGALENSAGQIMANLLEGCTWDTNLGWAALGGGVPGGVGGALGYRVPGTGQALRAWWQRYNAKAQQLRFVPEGFSGSLSDKLGDHATVPARELTFIQDTISPYTGDGIPLDDLIDNMASVGWRGRPLQVVKQDGRLLSLDHCRLAAAKIVGIDVPIQLVDLADPRINRQYLRKRSGLDAGIDGRYIDVTEGRGEERIYLGIRIYADGQIELYEP